MILGLVAHMHHWVVDRKKEKKSEAQNQSPLKHTEQKHLPPVIFLLILPFHPNSTSNFWKLLLQLDL
jgi:hypothetical protein